jgi:FkbM family methyltransferase
LIETNSTSVERRFKKLIPSFVKQFLVNIFCSSFFGSFIKLFLKKTLKGAKFNFKIVDSKSAAKIYFGIWESAEIRFAEKYVKNGDTVIELGSSVGVTMATLLSNKKLTKFIAVEANPKTFKLLNKTAEFYTHKAQDVVILNKAISYENSKYVRFSEKSLTDSKIQEDHEAVNKETIVEVSSITLNQLIKNYTQPETTYTLITDIEGAEAEIFFKDSLALTQCKTIVCELEDTQQYSMKSQIKELEKIGFKLIEFYGNVFAFQRTIESK